MARQRWRKALRILIGIVLMGGFVVVVFVVLSRYAGAWGVPYFSFTTERGSTCTNDFAGYTCTELTLAEVEYFGQFDLPETGPKNFEFDVCLACQRRLSRDPLNRASRKQLNFSPH